MIILSLFDGISAGRVALEKASLPIDKYYASEIDKYCLQISQKNYPDIIQLGDIKNWRDWNIEKPDLIMGGSPCQGFSFAGKQLAFNDKRSVLFFEFINILKLYKPKYFLLENVPMKKEFLEIISNEIGVQPILINSALVSAQQRKRYYWTNIENITQPNDKRICLKDVIENGFVDRDKSYCLDASYYKGTNLNIYFNKSRRQAVFNKPIKIGNFGKKCEYQKSYRKLTPLECERLQTFPDNYTEGVSNTQRYKMLGNSWTVDVITHILKFININKENKNGY